MGFGRQEITFLLCEAVCILFYGLFTEFKTGTDPKTNSNDDDVNGTNRSYMHSKYPLFQDVHVMIFIGFGFLMVFLKNNSWTSIGFNYLIACWAIQITILARGFWINICEYYHDENHHWRKIELNIEQLIYADFGAGAVLISFGAILGKCSLFQLWAMATIEIFFYALNETICVDIFKVSDIGGSMTIHTFGAYFGISVALFYQPKKAIADKHGIGVGNYLSDLVSMIGTLFLFCYWPSFNGALGWGSQQQRTVINTYLAISCSCIAAIISSKIIHHGKLEMEIVLNSSIAGGVAVGASADLIAQPFGAMLVGFVAGVISSFGYGYLSKWLQQKINLHDTCGVHNLHGMPGIIGALASAIIASRTVNTFGRKNFEAHYGIEGRTGSEQAGYQLASLAVTLGIAIVTGLFTGFITSRSWFQPPPEDYLFDDRYQWADCEIEHEQMADLQKQMSLSGTHSKLANLGKTENDDDDEDNLAKDNIQ